ncbi:MAG: dockerin type I domain-containing protein, partial [Planctomycetota bacterium]
QAFDGTDSIVGTGPITINLASGETRDVNLNLVSGKTDFIGVRLRNDAADVFHGMLREAVLEFEGNSLLVDSFFGQTSAPGESRATFPPGTTGGTVSDLFSGTDVALDRGLFGSTSSLSIANEHLNFSVSQLSTAEFDWGVGGYDFLTNGFQSLILRDLTNDSSEDVTLIFELFQTFDGTGSNVGTGPVSVELASGETRDVVLSVASGETDFIGVRLFNQSNDHFNGTIRTALIGPSVALGDVNCDGIVNLLDVAPFVDRVLSGMFDAKADINDDGQVNLLDVAPFVQLLTG